MSRAPLLSKAAAAAGLSAPALIAFCATAVDLGWLPFQLGFGVLTLRVAWVLIWVGLSVGLTAVAMWVRRRGPGLPLALIGVIAPLLTFAGFQTTRMQVFEHPPVHETSTDWTDPPAFARSRPDDALPVLPDPRVPDHVGDIHPAWAPYAGRRVAEVNAEVCPGARRVERLVPAEEVVAALEAEGVRVLGQGPFRVDGRVDGTFYGRARDVVVRMEPRATDIRIAERVGLSDLGETCRLVTAIVGRLSG